MIEEPYRWLEAIQNRREYIRDQMRGATPVFAISRPEGVLLLGVGTGQSKVFEIYDRQGYCALGNPVDIEKLRQTAIQAAHTEGFQRSPADVRLRRLINFALSPVLKENFEKIFSPPLMVESLFAEMGREPGEDDLVRLEFDGTPHYASAGIAVAAADGERVDEATAWLTEKLTDGASLQEVVRSCLLVWKAIVEERALEESDEEDTVGITIKGRVVEAALLDRNAKGPAYYRPYDAS